MSKPLYLNINTATKEELQELLARSENGTDDIISKRSKVIKEQNVDVEDMTVNELITFIQDNPSVLKRPILLDDRRFQVGYNSEEIRAFMPRDLRKLSEVKSNYYHSYAHANKPM